MSKSDEHIQDLLESTYGIGDVVLSRRESLTPPERDTNLSQVSPQQMLVLIYLPRKDGKLS